MDNRKVCLVILDGWGIAENSKNNAISQAKTPMWDYLLSKYPYSLLHASGEHVGLPEAQMGNSEVGHMTIGGGRLIYQDLGRIGNYIKNPSFYGNKDLLEVCSFLRKSGKTFHLMGLASPGGVHSHSDHLLALCKVIDSFSIKTCLHLFLDGRDVPPQSALQEIDKLEKQLPKSASIATIGGRFYAMDRDRRWDRTEKAYNAMANADAPIVHSALDYIKENYNKNITDEFIPPACMHGYDGVEDGDALLCFNFRADRSLQILEAFVDRDFKQFSRNRKIEFSFVYGMKPYSDFLNRYMGSLFDSLDVKNGLGEIVAENRKRQLRLAETEKYPHVTFFFNGGRNEPFEGEDRILIPSPKVDTYDLQPDMSAVEVTDVLIEKAKKNIYDFIVVNYANTDMVGHTGNFQAACEAVETIDRCLSRIYKCFKNLDIDLIITADHGNVEKMVDYKTGEFHTAHTSNLVPFIFISPRKKEYILRKKGSLSDVAPTVLYCLGLFQPAQMTGHSLFENTP